MIWRELIVTKVKHMDFSKAVRDKKTQSPCDSGRRNQTDGSWDEVIL